MAVTDAAPDSPIIAAVRRAARQEQFLSVLSREEAWARFTAALRLAPLGGEQVPLAAAHGRVLACSVAAPVDVPGFDRSGVDGFAVRAADTAGAREAGPVWLQLNAETLPCGVAPAIAVAPGTATVIATGGMIPRGADAVVMVEHTDLVETADGPAIAVSRAAAPGQFVTYAGSDIARGETILRAGARIGAREIGMLAAAGIDAVPVHRRPRVAVLSTGDELVVPGAAMAPGQVYDSNGAIIAAAVAEAGGEALPFGIVADDPPALEAAMRRALAEADMLVLSGGTSKGVGDISHRVLSRLGEPGILVHGVALKPGKPLCLAVAQGKPIAVLPGFPTSAIFTFHAFVAPVIRAFAGLPREAERSVAARVTTRLPSERGRTEFAMVALADTADGLAAIPLAKGSGAVTAFSQADGFVAIDALADGIEAGAVEPVRLIGEGAAPPDLVIAGSHCVGLDAVLDRLSGVTARVIALGSLGGLAAARRGECDLAPMHLLDRASGVYNRPFLAPGLALVPGWTRLQGIVFRKGDARFEGRPPGEAVAALADPDAVMVNRNQGAGTRILIDDLIAGTRPAGYFNQPKSHNAVAAAVAQGRADWGVAIATVARAYDLGFIPVADEHYDFALVEARRDRPGVQAFLAALAAPETAARLEALGFRRSAP